MKELFAESRYLKMAAAAIAAVMVICAIAGRFYAFGSGPSEEELMEIEKSGAKIAVPFDKYREIASIKGAGGAAAGKLKDDVWEIIDPGSGKNVEIQGFAKFVGSGGGFAFLCSDDGESVIVDAAKSLNSGKPVFFEEEKRYDSAYYDGESGVILVEESGMTRILSVDGKELYRTADENAWLIPGSKYVQESAEQEDRYLLRNIYTGEVGCRLNENEYVRGYYAGHFVVEVTENPEDLLQSTHNYLLSDSFVRPEGIEDFAFYSGDREYIYIYQEDVSSAEKIIDKTGQVAFEIKEDEERGSFVGISNDQVIYTTKEAGVMEYITIAGENKGAVSKHRELCMSAFEDGLATAGIRKGGNAGRMSDAIATESKNYIFGFIDEEFNHVTDFIFDWASEIEEGFAAVKIGGQYALLDLREV